MKTVAPIRGNGTTELALIAEIGDELAAAQSLIEVANILEQRTPGLLPSEQMLLATCDPMHEGYHLITAHTVGPLRPIDDSLLEHVLRTGMARHAEGVLARMEPALRKAMRVVHIIPLRAHEETIGALGIASAAKDALTVHHTEILGLLGRFVARAVFQIRERETVRRLLDVMAHDIRSPLTSVTGNIELLLLRGGTMSDEKRQTILQAASVATGRVRRTSEDLLIDLKVQAHVLRLLPQPVDVSALVDAAVKEVHERYRDYQFTIKHSQNRAQCRIDPDRVQQIVVRLLDNAARSGGRYGPIAIGYDLAAEQLHLCIEDNRPVNSEDTLRHLFTHLPDVGIPGRGTGVGLYLCGRLVKAMGGTIGVASLPGRGAHFEITLPV